jgi:hypothetical protein
LPVIHDKRNGGNKERRTVRVTGLINCNHFVRRKKRKGSHVSDREVVVKTMFAIDK